MNVKPIGTTKQVDKNLKILKRLCSQNVLKSTGCMASTPASLGTWPSIGGSSFRCGVVTFMETSFGRPAFGFWCPGVLLSGLRWLRHRLDHGFDDGRWHRHWHRHGPRRHCLQLSGQLMLHLPHKPWLHWPRMQQHRWLPEHGLLQHQAWLHRLHGKSGRGGRRS